MADKTINTRIVLRNDLAANWTSNNPVLKAGEIGLETDTLRIKIGDGSSQWKSLNYTDKAVYDAITAATSEFTEVTATSAQTDAEALATITNPKKSDIGVVKRAIGDSHYSYTGYVYNGTAWGAMDGNYSAENVYFNSDLTYTKAIGELPAVPSSGSATLSAKDKTVKEVLSTILAKKSQPSVSDASVSISGTQGSEDLEIGSNVSKSGTLTGSFNAGSYTYGPSPTGATVSSWEGEVKYTQGKSGSIASSTAASTPYTYSFQMGTDGETIKVNFKSSATHTQGNIAKDNLGGDSDPIKRVAAGTKTKDSTAIYTCYRKMFYGTRTAKDDLDSAKIRALSGIKQQAKSANSLDVSVPVGALRVIIACPAGRSVTSVHDRNGLGAEIFSSFKTTTVSVEGANGYTAVDYTVYYLDFANPNDKANHYDVTIA